MPATAPPRRIVLVGMMGSGKSTVGRALADALRWPFLDNDALVAEMTGRPGPEIFATDGELELHRAERAAFAEALARPAPAVITAAGSVVDDPWLRSVLPTAGWVVWLDAEPETLAERIGGGDGRRSDAPDQAWLTTLLLSRAPLWTAVADQIVEVDEATVDEVVDAIRIASGAVAGS
jgi:shikimate kinase